MNLSKNFALELKNLKFFTPFESHRKLFLRSPKKKLNKSIERLHNTFSFIYTFPDHDLHNEIESELRREKIDCWASLERASLDAKRVFCLFLLLTFSTSFQFRLCSARVNMKSRFECWIVGEFTSTLFIKFVICFYEFF